MKSGGGWLGIRAVLWAEGPSPTHCHTLSPQSSTKAILGSLAGERCSLILEPDLPVKSFLPRDWTERARCPSATAQSFESLFGNSFWGGRPVSLRGDPAHTRSVGCLKNPVGMAEANPELGFSLTLTQQSSRMISPLASQTAVESKAAHRSQAPERDGTALLISQSRGEKKKKECSGFAVPTVLQSTIIRQEKRRWVRWIHALSGLPSWEELVALPGQRACERNCSVLSPSRTALQDSGKKATEQIHDQSIKSFNYKNFFQSFPQRQPKERLHRASFVRT